MYYWLVFVVVIIIYLLYIYKSKSGGDCNIGGGGENFGNLGNTGNTGNSNYMDDGDDVNEIEGGSRSKNKHDWVLIHSNGCGHCTNQINILKENKINVKKFEVSKNPRVIKKIKSEGEIKGYPMWYNKKTKKRVYGCMDVGDLRNKLHVM